MPTNLPTNLINMNPVKLSKKNIDKLPFAERGQQFYWDTELQGFGLRVGSTSKSYFVERRVDGRGIRVTLGKHPALSYDQAKALAYNAIQKLIAGVDLNQEKASAKIKAVTLETVYDDFKLARSLKPNTLRTYNGDMRRVYEDWKAKQIVSITKDMVEDRHILTTIKSGNAVANRASRMLKAVINFAIAKYETSAGVPIMKENPVIRISKTKQWHRPVRKTGHLKFEEFDLLFAELDKLKNKMISDYLKFILFTGCRRSEASSLMWKHVNLKNRSFMIVDPKNHNPIELPLTNKMMEIMNRRRWVMENAFVFPAKSKSGHIEEPKKVVKEVGEKIEHHFTVHDLRRTYLTVAENVNIPYYTMKLLVNHKVDSADVTAGYIQISIDRLREPAQMITDFIIKNAYPD